MMQAVRTTIRMCLGSLIAVTAMAHGTSTVHAGPANVPLGLGRVAPGDCSPGAPTDPDVQISRIRFLR